MGIVYMIIICTYGLEEQEIHSTWVMLNEALVMSVLFTGDVLIPGRGSGGVC